MGKNRKMARVLGATFSGASECQPKQGTRYGDGLGLRRRAGEMQGRPYEVLTGGDGFRFVNLTYPQIIISPRISVTLFRKHYFHIISKIWNI